MIKKFNRLLVRQYASNKAEQKVALLKHEILSSTLKHVEKYGFEKIALQKGINDLNYPESFMNLYKDGVSDIIKDYLIQKRRETIQSLKIEKEKMHSSTYKIVKLGLETRLKLGKPYVKHWPKALATLTIEKGPQHALLELHNLVDDIWREANDQSYDLNWYSKRIVLAGIYSSTELFMVQDRSEDFTDTQRFMNDRFKDHYVLTSTLKRAKDVLSFEIDSLVGFVKSVLLQ